MMMDLLNELKSRKDREVRAQLEQQEIQKVLKEISRDKASALERDRRRELERIAAERENLRLREEACMDQITSLEEQKYEEDRKLQEQKARLQGKVDKSEYIQNFRKREIELAKKRGETLAQLKLQKELLEEDRKRIMDDLELAKNGDPAVLRKNAASRWAANDILAKGKVDFKNLQISEKDKNMLVEGQARINKLKEERTKMEKEAFPIIDELDILQKQYEDKAYNQKAQMVANDLDSRNIRPDFKADQMSHMRKILKNQTMNDDLEGTTNDLQNKMKTLKQNYIQNDDADPELQHRMDELQNAIKTAGQALPNIIPPPVAPGIPPLPIPGALPGGFPGAIPPFGPGMPPGMPPVGFPGPFGNPLAGAPNPNLNYLKSQIEQQEEENKKIEEKLSSRGGEKGGFNNIAKRAEDDIEMLKQKLLPNGFGIGMGKGGADVFPEDFVFRQNDFRSEDLEVEERALLSLFYQEYDHLRMLSRLPTNSELYRYKMDQYKELSTMRAEIEKVLHEQRLEKIRRDFEKAKYEDERRYNHERWIEEQKREILAAKLRNQATNAGNTRGMTRAYSQPDLGQHQAPRSSHAITAYPQPQTSRYDPESRNGNAPGFMNANINQQAMTHRPTYNAPQSARNRPPDTVHFQPPGTNQYNDGIPDTVVRDHGQDDDDFSYKPKNGLVIHFDFLTALERKHREVRLVYGVFNYTQNFNLSANKRHPNEVVANREVAVMQSEPDPANMTRNRVFYKKKHILKNIKPHAGINLIMEFQVKRTDTEPGDRRYASIGWSLMNLFDSSYELNTGQFRIPLYQTPTQPELDIRDIPNLKKIEKAMFCFRISVPKDALSKLQVLPDTHPGHYSIPRIHTEILDKEAIMGNQKEMAQFEEKQRARIKNNVEEAKHLQEAYECSGINVFVHYVKNYEPTGLLRIRCTLYEGPNLLRDNNGLSCQWVSRIVHPEEAIVANQGNMEKLMKMGVYIYSETKYGKKDVVVPINDDKSWLRDFYTMLWDNNMKNEIYMNVELLVKENPYKSGTYRNLYVDEPETKLEEYTPIATTTVK